MRPNMIQSRTPLSTATAKAVMPKLSNTAFWCLFLWLGLMMSVGALAQTVTVETTIPGLPLASLPSAIVLNPVTNAIYVANSDAFSLCGMATTMVIDGATNAVTPVVSCVSNSMAVNPAANKVYLTHHYGGVTIIDGATNAAIDLPVGLRPRVIAVNPVTNMIYVPDAAGNIVEVLDGSGNSVTTVNVQGIPSASAINPNTNKIYVAGSDAGSVTVIDGVTNIPATIPVGASPVALAVNPVTNKIYVANSGDNTITVIDGATNATSTITVGNGPSALAINTVTNQIYVINGGDKNVTVIDGASANTTTLPVVAGALAVNSVTNKIYLTDAGSNTVTMIDGYTNNITPVSAGNAPGPLAVNPVTNKIYVANSDGSVAVLDGAINPTALAVTCTAVTYDGQPHACTGSATGVDGAAVAGTWSFTPATATNAGRYPVTGTFTSNDPGYAGGTASGTLFIARATPAVTVTCGTFTYDGTAHNCTAVATGVGGAAVAGSFSYFTSGSFVNSGLCTVEGDFASGDPNYLNSYGYGRLEIDPTVSFSPGLMSFGSQLTGTTSVAQYVTVVNNGTLPATVNGVSMGGANPADYQVSDYSGTCSTTMVLAAKKKCVLRVIFAPNAAGASSAYLVVNSPASAFFMTGLQGTGVAPAPQLTVSASALTFSMQTTGTSSVAQYVLITSTGTGPLHLTSVTVGGANAGDFAVSDQAGTCVEGATLAYNAKCNLRVVFTPTGAGQRTATLYLNDDVAGTPQQITLSGTGQLPARLTVSATSLTFASQTVGTSSVAQYVLVTSVGSGPATITGVTTAGAAAADYLVSDQAGTCVEGATLAPGAKCNLRVVFKPTATGDRSASVVVASNAGSQTVLVDGTGR